MKALIIGYGSIGRRHAEVLNSFNEIGHEERSSIDIGSPLDLEFVELLMNENKETNFN